MLLQIGGWFAILLSLAHIVGMKWVDQLFIIRGQALQLERHTDTYPLLPYYQMVFAAVVFFIIGLYGLCAGGVIRKNFPLLKSAIFTIAVVFLLRAVGGYLYAVCTHIHAYELIHSGIALTIGLLYLFGGLKKWGYIS